MKTTRQNILIVNANASDRRIIRDHLASLGLVFAESSSGEEAHNLLRVTSFDLVIIDIAIGDLDGGKLTKLIRRGLYRTAAWVPVILVTRNWCEQIKQIAWRDFLIDHQLSFNAVEQLPQYVRTCLSQKGEPRSKAQVLAVTTALTAETELFKSLVEYYDIDFAVSVEIGRAWLKNKDYDLIMLDSDIHDDGGRRLLSEAISTSPDRPVVMLVDSADIDRLADYMKRGAADFIDKPLKKEALLELCELALRRSGSLLCYAQCARRAENYRRLQLKFKNVINSMPSILVGVDQKLVVNVWNREAEVFSGLPAEAALGKQLSEVWPECCFLDSVKQALTEGLIKSRSKIPCPGSKTRKYIDLTVYPLLNDTRVDAVIRVDDVTERVLLEERIIQSEKMVSMGHLAAGLAHEINNPLAGVMQNVQVVRNRLAEYPPANIKAARETGLDLTALGRYVQQRQINSRLDAIMESGSRAAKMIENMLSFGRKDISSMLPENLAELLDRSVELAASNFNLKQKSDFRQIQICREYDSSASTVKCNATQMQQVFMNLLMNGAFYMDIKRQELFDQGISYQPCFSLRLRDIADSIIIEIEDNGPGIEAEAQRHIFDPFFTASRISKGAGLGLAICYFIICENHHGELSVESTLEKGSNFIIKLPK